ncbi:MAG: PQQ-binding-like beta-propeller repeat protein [Planctomycetaceae bacterium]|nr:PQQ-binding-like beta-propeller repeat protein [Planctomycetaceae bacterium]
MQTVWVLTRCGAVLLLALLTGCQRRPRVETSPVEGFAEEFAEIASPSFSDDDWPWWRGSSRDGKAIGSAPIEWSDETNVVWKVAVPGRGHASPTVVGDSIYLATANEQQQTQSVVAFDRESGEQQWLRTLHKGNFPLASQMHKKGTHANGTVACDGERLFVTFLYDNTIWMTALDLIDDRLWSTNVGEFDPVFGYGPSPCVYESLVIISGDHISGGWLAGLHRETGDIVWKAPRPEAQTFSSAVIAPVGGKDLLVISGAEYVAAYDPLTGEEQWMTPGTTLATCGSCVWDGDTIFASGGYPDKQTIAVSATGAEQWSNQVKCYEQSMLAHQGYLYGFDDNGIIYCWDAANGKEQWKGRLGGPVSASLVLADGNLYATNERGTTFVVRADPAKFQKLAENKLGEESFATPTICGGRIYHRVAINDETRQEWLYCLGNPSPQPDGGG